MQYRTIVLDLLAADPPLYRRLKATRRLNRTLLALAADLERTHRAWVAATAGPDEDPAWAEATAREFALADLAAAIAEVRAMVLPPEPPTVPAAPNLDDAMAFLRRHTPPA